MACGPDPAPIFETVSKMIEDGIDHVYMHQVGADQEGFCRFWRDELSPELERVRR